MTTGCQCPCSRPHDRLFGPVANLCILVGTVLLAGCAGCGPSVGSGDGGIVEAGIPDAMFASTDLSHPSDAHVPDDLTVEGPPPCDAGLCGDACVNVAYDNVHCGSCGTLCCPGAICLLGRCQGGCQMGLTQCGELHLMGFFPDASCNLPNCVNLNTDPSNCGQCGNACGPGKHCQQGTCIPGDGGA
jgi:hypothetical protein